MIGSFIRAWRDPWAQYSNVCSQPLLASGHRIRCRLVSSAPRQPARAPNWPWTERGLCRGDRLGGGSWAVEVLSVIPAGGSGGSGGSGARVKAIAMETGEQVAMGGRVFLDGSWFTDCKSSRGLRRCPE